MINKLGKEIFSINANNFNELAIKIFHDQYNAVAIYQRYVNILYPTLPSIEHYSQIPFLPISFFKSHEVHDETVTEHATIFESSTTTSQTPSKHIIADIEVYRASFRTTFKQFFGDMKEYCILGLLPSYIERGQSSLVFMVNDLIAECQHPKAGFYLHNQEELFNCLMELERQQQKTILIGVTYALLDFAEKFTTPLRHVSIMETGGMKGRRTEVNRTEVHNILKERFGLTEIFSEYGMTELLSQAYSLQDEIFKTPPWMKVLVRDINNPMELSTNGRGALNIIDLANIHSCCFIGTEDIGDVYKDSSFKVLGRLQQSELRGCSLLTL